MSVAEGPTTRATLSAAHLRAALRTARAYAATANDAQTQNSDPAIRCALIEFGENTVRVVGTDKNRLVAADLPANVQGPTSMNALLTPDAVNAALEQVERGAEQVLMKTGGGPLTLRTTDGAITLSLSNRRYPDYRKHLRLGPQSARIALMPAELLSTLEEIGDGHAPAGHSPCDHDPVYMRAKEGTLTLRHSHTGVQRDLPAARVEGKALVALSATYIADAARALSAETVITVREREQFITVASAAAGPPSLTQHIMPMRAKIWFE